MAGLKAWDGSAFVDGQPRIWNGTTFVAPSACHIWDGSGFVKVWPSFSRQRMIKVGAHKVGGAVGKVLGWASDSTYPATVTSDSLIVQGSGACMIAAQVSETHSLGNAEFTLRRNGVVIATQLNTGSLTAFSVAQTVAAGDTIELYAKVSPSGTINAANTYVEVIPT